ncbi:hypothetical protein B1526_1444 [Bifidobacterium criceti]|uniref:Uncharacterized protein n=1 Tax=Bifidobacterium criceti TaxID=1960969 RepID=A0A2A2EDZ3_9BIFI|nr:hypothetical protein B1526_1444 [Bifidobacterium criceti]
MLRILPRRPRPADRLHQHRSFRDSLPASFQHLPSETITYGHISSLVHPHGNGRGGTLHRRVNIYLIHLRQPTQSIHNDVAYRRSHHCVPRILRSDFLKNAASTGSGHSTGHRKNISPSTEFGYMRLIPTSSSTVTFIDLGRTSGHAFWNHLVSTQRTARIHQQSIPRQRPKTSIRTVCHISSTSFVL